MLPIKIIHENVRVDAGSTEILQVSASSKLIEISAGIFTGLALVDFSLQTILILFVFLSIVRGSGWKGVKNGFCAFLIILTFVSIRLSLLPTLLTSLSVDISAHFESFIPVTILFYFNLTLICSLFAFSSAVCVYFMVKVKVSGVKKVATRESSDKPMVVILMPIYNEEPSALFRAVESAIRCDYPTDRKHLFLSFDDDQESALYLALMKKLHVLTGQVAGEILAKFYNDQSKVTSKMIFPQRLELVIEGVKVTFCRFPHEGKSATQAKSFNLINDLYGSDPVVAANTLILFIDSDIILHENAVHNFVHSVQERPELKAATGLITCRTSRQFNLYQYLQDSEYVEGQMFVRTVEASLGGVTCLPGALTLTRLDALQKVAPKYFIDLDKSQTIDYHRFHLGEDRFMTFLLMELDNSDPYEITFVSSAQCKTEAPDSFRKLLKQRRRWFLGGLTNDLAMLSSPLMWRKYPLILLFKFYFYSIRGMDWLFWAAVIYFIQDLSNNEKRDSLDGFGVMIYVVFAFFGLKLLLLTLNSFLMNRMKIPVSIVLLFFVMPLFNLIVILYSLWTWNVRSWGGPRTDGEGQLCSSNAAESQVKIINEVMKQKEELIGLRRKSLTQIKIAGRLIQSRLESNRLLTATLNQINECKEESKVPDIRIIEPPKDSAPPPPIKKFVPFPYQMEFVGGGDPTTVRDNFLKPDVIMKSPVTLTLARSRRESVSMPDLSKLVPGSSDTGNYLFESLSPSARERASSFRLNKEDLVQLEALTTLENSGQHSSQFILEISGRLSPKTQSS